MELENIMLSDMGQSPKIKGQMFSLVSGQWYIMRVGVGIREEWRNFKLLRGKWKEGGGRVMKDGEMRQTSLPYVHVWLQEWYDSTSCTTTEMKWCIPFLYNASKYSL